MKRQINVIWTVSENCEAILATSKLNGCNFEVARG